MINSLSLFFKNLNDIEIIEAYIKQNLFNNLYERGLKMIHGIKKNMKNKFIIVLMFFLVSSRLKS